MSVMADRRPQSPEASALAILTSRQKRLTARLARTTAALARGEMSRADAACQLEAMAAEATMSFPDVRAWAIARAESGVAPAEIARRTGEPGMRISRWLCEARRAGREVPSFAKGRGVTVLSGEEATRDLLQAEAAARGLTERQLREALLRAIATDNLFNAVLEENA